MPLGANKAKKIAKEWAISEGYGEKAQAWSKGLSPNFDGRLFYIRHHGQFVRAIAVEDDGCVKEQAECLARRMAMQGTPSTSPHVSARVAA